VTDNADAPKEAVLVWQFLAHDATPFMEEAVRVFGRRVLAPAEDSAALDSRAMVGRRLLHLVFGTHDAGQELPGALADLVADPDSQRALAGLTHHLDETLDADPPTIAAAVEMLTEFYRRRAGVGEIQALVDLGDLLYWGDPEGVRAAYQEAVDAGHRHAIIDLAKVLHARLQDDDAALAVYQQAIDSGDPDLAAEAMVDLAEMWFAQGNEQAARAAYQRAIETRHPEWGAAAMLGLAGEMRRQDDLDAALALYRRAIEVGSPDRSAQASLLLAELLDREGDVSGARATWQRVIDSGNPKWAGPALTEMVNLLRQQDDLDGLRALYEKGVETGNPDTLYALDVLGQELEHHGDTEGAHAAWQRAIDAGYEFADDLRERISPSPEPEDEPDDEDGLADVPPEFDPRNLVRIGIDVLEHGLPALPETLSYRMAIPVAYWEADQCAVVLTLRFSRHGRGKPMPMAVQATYSRTPDGWTAPAHLAGTGFSHDPVASPGDRRDLGGRAIVTGGGSVATEVTPGHPAVVAVGRAGPDVRYLAVIKNGQEDRRPLDSHFGAWIVCTEQLGPFEIVAFDENGTVLARISDDGQPPTRPEPVHPLK
jgi:tetratricopeptide (TPR) repeat protein